MKMGRNWDSENQEDRRRREAQSNLVKAIQEASKYYDWSLLHSLIDEEKERQLLLLMDEFLELLKQHGLDLLND